MLVSTFLLRIRPTAFKLVRIAEQSPTSAPESRIETTSPSSLATERLIPLANSKTNLSTVQHIPILSTSLYAR